MKIGLTANSTRDIDYVATRRCIEYLRDFDAVMYVSDELDTDFGLPTLSRERMMRELDFVFVFGGDGTILRFLDGLSEFNAAILAFNLGNLGYLTECDIDRLSEAIDALFEGRFEIDRRSTLCAIIGDERYYALNEVLLSRGMTMNTLPIAVYLDDQFLQNYVGDGVIAATPTGSTAYSLSAGGPILSPDVSAYLLTPVCPHSIAVRPMVVASSCRLQMKCTRAGVSAHIYIDGVDKGVLPTGQTLEIEQSDKTVSFVRIFENNFYAKILHTLQKRR